MKFKIKAFLWFFVNHIPVSYFKKNIFFKFTWIMKNFKSPFIQMLIDKGIRQLNMNKSQKTKVMFFRMRFVPRHNMLDLALAINLNDKNVDCVFVNCNSILPVCNGWDGSAINNYKKAISANICSYCDFNHKLFSELIPFPTIFLKDFITDTELSVIKKNSLLVKLDDLHDVRFENIDIGNELYISMAKYLFVGTIPETSENNLLAQKFYEAGYIIFTCVRKMIEIEKPDRIILNAGHIFWFGIIYKIAQTYKIKTITYDETNIKVTELTWMFDASNPVVDYNYKRQWEQYKNNILTDIETDAVEKLFKDRQSYYLYKKGSETKNLDNIDQIKEKYIKVFVLFTNVLWDATIVGKHTLFESLVDWVKYTINYFENNPDYALIVRVHPAEKEVYGMRSKETVVQELLKWRPDLRKNIFIIDSNEIINSYSLINMSDGIFVYASNIGIEALFMNKPVIVCGKAHYIEKGLLHEPKTIDEYENYLKFFCSSNPQIMADELSLLKKYCYLVYFKSQIQMDIFVDSHPHKIENISKASLSELSNDITLNLLSNWILDEKSEGLYLQG